jgi:hypothetical protein
MRWGRALLLGRGLAAWLEAHSASPDPSREEPRLGAPEEASGVAEVSLSAQVYRDAIDVFSEMVLASCRS